MNFKLFEASYYEDELINQLSDDFIDKYFRKNYSADIEEIIGYVDFWRFVDDDHFIKNFIYNEVQSASMDQFVDEDYKDYIKNNLLKYAKVERFLDRKAKKLDLEDRSYEDIIDNLDDEDLIEIIKSTNKEEDFFYYVYEDRYSNYSARDILIEFYTEEELNGKQGYKAIEYYVNDDDIIKAFYDETDADFKKDYILSDISSNKEIQLNFLKMKSENAIALFDIMNQKYSIGDTYKFQNTYMKEIIKDCDLETDELYIAKKFKALNDKFGLAPGIEKKYDRYGYYINIEKYNL